MRGLELSGFVVGLLTVISKTRFRGKDGGILWECLCECGNTVTVSASSIKTQNTKSCGCLLKTNFQEYRKSIGKDPNILLTSETSKLRDEFKRSKISKTIFIRDEFTCKLCNISGGELNAHHIIPTNQNATKLLDENNLITLCRACHYLAHNKGIWKSIDVNIQKQLISLANTRETKLELLSIK